MRCFRAAIHKRLGSSDLVVFVVITINYDDNIADFISPGHSTAPGDSPPAPTPTSLNVPAINIIGANHQRVSPAGFIFFLLLAHINYFQRRAWAKCLRRTRPSSHSPLLSSRWPNSRQAIVSRQQDRNLSWWIKRKTASEKIWVVFRNGTTNRLWIINSYSSEFVHTHAFQTLWL